MITPTNVQVEGTSGGNSTLLDYKMLFEMTCPNGDHATLLAFLTESPDGTAVRRQHQPDRCLSVQSLCHSAANVGLHQLTAVIPSAQLRVYLLITLLAAWPLCMCRYLLKPPTARGGHPRTSAVGKLAVEGAARAHQGWREGGAGQRPHHWQRSGAVLLGVRDACRAGRHFLPQPGAARLNQIC